MQLKFLAASIARMVPGRGPASVILSPDTTSVQQTGTISGSGNTITGSGTSFQTGAIPIVAGNVIVANNQALTVLSVASDTSLKVSTNNLNFSGQAFNLCSSVVNVSNAWEKPLNVKRDGYGYLNMQGNETLIKVPDNELNSTNTGNQIRFRDQILWNGITYEVLGSTLKTVRTAWECVVRKVMA